MYKALALAKKIQECLDEGRFFEIEGVVKTYEKESGELKASNILYEQKRQLYQTIYDLERLRPEWNRVLEEMYRTLYAGGEESYVQLQREFKAYLSACPKRLQQWENVGLQLFVFFVYTYFCGAVYDDWIYSKMALAVHSTEFIRELLMARWKQTGQLEMEDYVELSYRYAREIEHSDQNLNELEEVFMSEKHI